MNKNMLLFLSALLIVLVSNPLAAMGSDADESPLHKKKAEEHSSAAKKRTKNKKPQAAPAAAATASVHLQLAPAAAANACATEESVPLQLATAAPVVAAKPKVSAPQPLPEADGDDELEGEMLPNANETIVEVELNPADKVAFMQQKATNYVWGTHNTLLTKLRALGKNEITSNSLPNQSVILSAVTNLVELCGVENCIIKKACLDDIAELLKYSETYKGGKPVITIDQGPAEALKVFLTNHQKKLFAAFHAFYIEQIKPVCQIAELNGKIDKILGHKSVDDVNLSSLSRINVRALDKIMHDMAGKTADNPQDLKHNS